MKRLFHGNSLQHKPIIHAHSEIITIEINGNYSPIGVLKLAAPEAESTYAQTCGNPPINVPTPLPILMTSLQVVKERGKVYNKSKGNDRFVEKLTKRNDWAEIPSSSL